MPMVAAFACEMTHGRTIHGTARFSRRALVTFQQSNAIDENGHDDYFGFDRQPFHDDTRAARHAS